MIRVQVCNRSSVVTDEELIRVTAALRIQARRDFYPPWGVYSDVTPVKKSETPRGDTWHLMILDNSDEAGALGYHDLTPTGLPLGKVFAKTDQQYGENWSTTASHELLEMFGDPYINLTAQVGSTLYAYETADAVEREEYDIDGVKVSNFVLPSWFINVLVAGQKYDFLGTVKRPLQLRPGGYISVLKLGSNDGWTQVYGQSENSHDEVLHGLQPGEQHTYGDRPRVGSRRERRRVPQDQWQFSTP